jgi:beta-mannan synthase
VGDQGVGEMATVMALVDQAIQLWLAVRAPVVAPLLQFAINVCLVMVTMLFVERIFMCGVMVFVKLLRRSPATQYKFEPIRDDMEFGNSAYPLVLVQVPMFNEREVYQLSIQAVCGLSWPSDRIIVQVLDDSTDPTTMVHIMSLLDHCKSVM